MKRLNIGCGNEAKEYKKNGYINLDIEPNENVHVVHDLNIFPYPFKDNTFDEIYASHIIEHLINPYMVLMELYRILKSNGVIIVKLPTTRRSCLGHLRTGHTRDYFDCLTHNNIGFDSKPLFHDIHVKGRKFDIGRTWFNFRDWLLNNIYQEWEYRLVKK